jgi:hypothetical protein
MDAAITIGSLLVATLFEWWSGKYRDGKKTAMDWKMAGLCTLALAAFQRPFVNFATFSAGDSMFSRGRGALAFLERDHVVLCAIAYVMLSELVHGIGHRFAHATKIRGGVLGWLQRAYFEAHRPHHLSGDDDDKGQLSATHIFIEGWTFWLIMPTFYVAALMVYLGLEKAVLYGTLFTSAWGIHVHANWTYDLYFLKHRSPWVRLPARALAHVFTFPTAHHQHHARGKASNKNFHNCLALWDWLLWDSLLIPDSRPAIYGWRTPRHDTSALRRFFHHPFGRDRAGRPKGGRATEKQAKVEPSPQAQVVEGSAARPT